MGNKFVSDESRNAEIERIHTEAVGTVLHAANQIFAAISRELISELKKHDQSIHTISVARVHEEAANSLVESIKQSLADDLPYSAEVAVELHDHFDILDEDQVSELAAKVRATFRDLMGSFA